MPIVFQEPRFFLMFFLLAPAFFLLWLEYKKKSRVSFVIGKKPREIFKGQLKKSLLISLCFVFLVLALAKPVIYSKRSISPQRTQNQVILVFDESRSMGARKSDSGPTRLERAKTAAVSILPQLIGRRTIVYGFTSALVPLTDWTYDISYVEKTISEVVKIEGVTGTGSPIAKSIFELAGEFNLDELGEKTIILFSDGEDEEFNTWFSELYFQRLGVRIVAIGVGEEKGSKITLLREDWEGKIISEQVTVFLEPATLKALAAASDGAYFRENEIFQLKSYLANLKGNKLFGKTEQSFPQDISGFFIVGAILTIAAIWRFYR